jgi:sugar O-acyltransferase (sialic acid O-acetyltransferase NeuD family)
MKILIIGAGGHGEVVADICLSRTERGDDLELVGYLDDDPALPGRLLLGGAVLGPVASVGCWPHDAVVVAIGANGVRQIVSERLLRCGETLAALVHPAATVLAGATMGPGSVVCAGAVIGVGTRLGSGVIVNTCASIDHHSVLGDFCHAAPGVHTGGGVTIGCGALIGVGASILPGRCIGDWATVGAGAVVTGDVLGYATAVGVPAKVIAQKENG